MFVAVTCSLGNQLTLEFILGCW